MGRAQLTTQAKKLLTRFVREGAILRGDRPNLVYWAEQFAAGAPVDKRHVLEALSRFEELGIPEHRREEPPGVLCEPQLVCRDFRPEAVRPGVFIRGGSKLTPQEIAQYAPPCPEPPSPEPPPPCPPGFDMGEPFELGELTGQRGADTEIIYTTGRGQARFEAFYALVMSDEVIPSHNPHSFALDPRFPAELQERDYTRDAAEREKVMLNSGPRFNPAILLNNTPSAVDGPPIITPEGFVIGGNSRAMIIKRIQTENGANADAYAQAIVEDGPCLGLGGAEDFGVYGRMVVRVVPDFSGIRREEVSRALNRPLTQELAPESAAPSLGSLLTPRVLELATGEAGKTIAQNIRANNEEIARALQEASIITEQNRALWLVKERGDFVLRLRKAGQEKLSGAIMGAVLPDAELLASTPQNYRALYEEIAPVLLGIRSFGKLASDFDLFDAFQTAARDVPELAGLRNAREAGNYIAQAPVLNGGLEVLSAPLPAAQMLLAMFLSSRNKTKRTEFGRRFRRYGQVVSDYVAKAKKAKSSLFSRNVQAPDPHQLQTEILDFEPVPELGIEPIVLLTSALLVGAGEREQAAGILTAAASAIADAPTTEVVELELGEVLAELEETKLTTKAARELVAYLVRVSPAAQEPAERLLNTSKRSVVLDIVRAQFERIASEKRAQLEDDPDVLEQEEDVDELAAVAKLGDTPDWKLESIEREVGLFDNNPEFEMLQRDELPEGWRPLRAEHFMSGHVVEPFRAPDGRIAATRQVGRLSKRERVVWPDVLTPELFTRWGEDLALSLNAMAHQAYGGLHYKRADGPIIDPWENERGERFDPPGGRGSYYARVASSSSKTRWLRVAKSAGGEIAKRNPIGLGVERDLEVNDKSKGRVVSLYWIPEELLEEFKTTKASVGNLEKLQVNGDGLFPIWSENVGPLVGGLHEAFAGMWYWPPSSAPSIAKYDAPVEDVVTGKHEPTSSATPQEVQERINDIWRIVSPDIEMPSYTKRWKEEPPGSNGGYFFIEWMNPHTGDPAPNQCVDPLHYKDVLRLLKIRPEQRKKLFAIWWIPMRYAFRASRISCNELPSAIRNDKLLPIWDRESGALAGGINNPGHLKNVPAQIHKSLGRAWPGAQEGAQKAWAWMKRAEPERSALQTVEYLGLKISTFQSGEGSWSYELWTGRSDTGFPSRASALSNAMDIMRDTENRYRKMDGARLLSESEHTSAKRHLGALPGWTETQARTHRARTRGWV